WVTITPTNLTVLDGLSVRSNGRLVGFDTITGDATNDGLVIPRNRAMAIDGNYIQDSDGAIRMYLWQDGTSDVLHVTGHVTLNGKFIGERYGFFTPDFGTVYTII